MMITVRYGFVTIFFKRSDLLNKKNRRSELLGGHEIGANGAET
jgi:hypothetical protein